MVPKKDEKPALPVARGEVAKDRQAGADKMKMQMHGNWCVLVDDQNKPITNKTWWETYVLAKEWSIRSGKNLTPIPVKTAEALCQKDKAFKQLLIDWWIWNAEIMKSCKNHEEIRKKLKLKTKYVYQWSDDDGLSSVRSDWDSDEGCFYANALGPSGRSGDGVATFLVVKKVSSK